MLMWKVGANCLWFHLPSPQVSLLMLSFPFSLFFFSSRVLLSFPCLNYPVSFAIVPRASEGISQPPQQKLVLKKRQFWNTLFLVSSPNILHHKQKSPRDCKWMASQENKNRKNTTGDVGGDAWLTQASASQSAFRKTSLLKMYHEKALPCTRNLRNATTWILFWGGLQCTQGSTKIPICLPAKTLVELLSALSLDTEPIRWPC